MSACLRVVSAPESPREGGHYVTVKNPLNEPLQVRDENKVYMLPGRCMITVQVCGTEWVEGYEATLSDLLRAMVNPDALPVRSTDLSDSLVDRRVV